MEQLIKFLEHETEKADKRYQLMCRDIESGLENVGGVDAMARRVVEAQREKTLYNFFYIIRARYEADVAQDDMPEFITYCLELIQDEFSERVKVPALTEARQMLLKELTPILAGA
ncbi:hypothetical protein [Alteromonas gracilis]|uniref:hypothetical protein n=1 Tax=Alteromonas gracilis TaxID=1479524 RepID=UPI0037355C6D